MENINIKTKEYQVTEKQLFKVLSTYYYKKAKMYIVISSFLVLFNLFQLFIKPSTVFLPLLILWVVYIAILYFFIPFWVYKTAAQNKYVFQQTRVEIETNFFTVFYYDGSFFKYRLSNFYQAEIFRNFYCVYVTKASVYYIPKAAFYTKADVQLFELMLKTKKLLA